MPFKYSSLFLIYLHKVQQDIQPLYSHRPPHEMYLFLKYDRYGKIDPETFLYIFSKPTE